MSFSVCGQLLWVQFVCLIYLLLTHILRKPINVWILGIFQLLETICNITYEIRGGDNVFPNML